MDFDLTLPIDPNAWTLNPAVTLLNHGSFGACPRAVLEHQTELRARMESEPVGFLVRQLQPLLDESRAALAECVGAEPNNLVFVSNATAGVNAVVRSLRFQPGDELLVTNHGYNACNNVVRYAAQRDGATVVTVEMPIPVESPQRIVETVLARATNRTRLAVLDHITSPTAIVFPIDQLVRRLQDRGIDVLVDGAHAPGMVPLNLRELDAAYYTGNCHKWLCAPKGSGFLVVRPDRQADLQPPVISHGYNQPRTGYSRYQDAFDWQGTDDPTAWLCVGRAIRFLSDLLPGGLETLMQRNHALAVAGRRLLCGQLPVCPVCPETMLGSMAAVVLPESAGPPSSSFTLLPATELGKRLLERHGLEVPVFQWPNASQTILRISAQAYNTLGQDARLAEALLGK
jgi:isopenicillin-N epimerase